MRAALNWAALFGLGHQASGFSTGILGEIAVSGVRINPFSATRAGF
jgi:hypothetical protein